MESGKSFCFVGDSITKGNEIYGIHWYEPLIPYIRGNISDFSHGGWTVSDLVKRKSRLPSSDIYVVAIGINDVMHPDSVRSAATAEDYVQSIRQLTESIVSVSPNAKIYFSPDGMKEQLNAEDSSVRLLKIVAARIKIYISILSRQ